jgi:very-short-patch-repair endonuclease
MFTLFTQNGFFGGHVMAEYRGREIPWHDVVKFHKEIAIRAEDGFFSLYANDPEADRWSSLENFSPDGLAGPWSLDTAAVVSSPFRNSLQQNQHDSIFLGGPGYPSTTRGKNGWITNWCPLIYREIKFQFSKEAAEIIPIQGNWYLNPLIYGLLERLNVGLQGDLDEFAGQLIERAAQRHQAMAEPIGKCLIDSLVSMAPELASDITREIDSRDVKTPPSSWVLFSPTKQFSALTRHLVQDYERLDNILAKEHPNLGGFKVLEDRGDARSSTPPKIMPLMPLNVSQQRAMEDILSEKPLSVISGPPGCGKSQVVVATLLNAWANGQTALFVSNNNKAVDVVRERLERFESEFPIAVRAGNLKHNNIVEVLRRTLNMISASSGNSDGSLDDRISEGRKTLTLQKEELKKSLETQLPQRIDQARSAALKAYAEYRSRVAEIEKFRQELQAKKEVMGFATEPPNKIQSIHEDAKRWISRVDHYRQLIADDNRSKKENQGALSDLQSRRGRAVEEVGLEQLDAGDWSWLVSGPSPEKLVDWESRLKLVLETPIEQSLEDEKWEAEYSQWNNALDSQTCSDRLKAFANQTRKDIAAFAPALAEIGGEKEKYDREKTQITGLSIPEEINVSAEELKEWVGVYAELSTNEQKASDFLPWSRHSRLQKTLTRIERSIRSSFPLKIWGQIGVLDDDGRRKAAPIFERTLHWITRREHWETWGTRLKQIDLRFEVIRRQAATLRVPDIPAGHDLTLWRHAIEYCERESQIADAAAAAWIRRTEKSKAANKLRDLAAEWSTIASGVPIREAWTKGQGQEFEVTINSLGESPAKNNVISARSVLYSGALSKLVSAWKSAFDFEQQARAVQTKILNTPEPSDRITAWWAERPKSCYVINTKPSSWPEEQSYQPMLNNIETWLTSHKGFEKKTRPELERKSDEEFKWSIEQLEQAINILPAAEERAAVLKIFKTVQSDRDMEWPIDQINEYFAAFRPDQISAKIDRIDAELEQSSFNEAKTQWLERLKKDDEAVLSVDNLEKSIRRNRNRLQESDYPTFKNALRAVPIWITTAQAPQAIPLVPELFDIVIIDEASQCTVTNLLPLMYRGKSLAVIGDDQQLPAIPTIGEVEEDALAHKFNVHEHLGIIGHASNDVYKAAVDSLPRRRADVVFLEEHFRSHPQIIGFSNRHIYQQRLQLKKNPEPANRPPVSGGIHRCHVSGQAQQGPRGRSWVNRPEAQEVIELIKRIRNDEGRSFSLGVVTPFSAQKEVIRDLLTNIDLASDVLVDSAHGFQGDERDIMIFSPVVANGITPSACRWIESPPNLINVALTRAREALFVVADIHFCKRQEGILRQLAYYVDEVQLLRDTSEAELELFSWMVIEGITPEVHPRVGDLEVDFVLKSLSGQKIVIEVDGKEFHDGRQEQDKVRDVYLKGQGFKVQHFTAREVFETPFEVLSTIRKQLSDNNVTRV